MESRNIIKNILINNYSNEFIGKDFFKNCLIVLNNSVIFFFLPFYLLKVSVIEQAMHEKKPPVLNECNGLNKILFRMNFEVRRNIISHLWHRTNFNILTLEFRTWKNFLYSLIKPRMGYLPLGPYNFLISTNLKISGFGKINWLNYKLESNPGFNTCNFYFSRIFPYYFRKKIKVLKGIKFTVNNTVHPTAFLFLWGKYDYNIWFSQLEHKKNLMFLQICNLQILKVEKVSILFKNANCSIYLSIKSVSFLSTFRLLIDKKKNYLKIENLGKIEDSLLLSLTNICWGSGTHTHLIGGFIDGKIIVWNEILLPILKFLTYGFSIINFKNGKRFFQYIFILKKNHAISKNSGKKIFQKFLPQTVLSGLKVSKFRKTENLNKKWFLLNIRNIKIQYKPRNEIFHYSEFLSKRETFFLEFNRYSLFSLEKIKSKYIHPNRFLNLKETKGLSETEKAKKNFKKKKATKLSFNLFIIGNNRYLTRKEIYSEQYLKELIYKNFYFRKCSICLRICGVNPKLTNTISCPFYHNFEKQKMFRKIDSIPDTLKNKEFDSSEKDTYSLYYPIFRDSVFEYLRKNNPLQKEVYWRGIFNNFN